MHIHAQVCYKRTCMCKKGLVRLSLYFYQKLFLTKSLNFSLFFPYICFLFLYFCLICLFATSLCCYASNSCYWTYYYTDRRISGGFFLSFTENKSWEQIHTHLNNHVYLGGGKKDLKLAFSYFHSTCPQNSKNIHFFL